MRIATKNPPSGALSDSGSRQKPVLANLRHELRTPLNAIIGYSEMLLEDAADEASAQVVTRVQQIRRNGAALLALVNTLLDGSKFKNADRAKQCSELSGHMRQPLDDILADAKFLIVSAAGLGVSRF